MLLNKTKTKRKVLLKCANYFILDKKQKNAGDDRNRKRFNGVEFCISSEVSWIGLFDQHFFEITDRKLIDFINYSNVF